MIFSKEKWLRRDSGIELMRIICLTMIVMHHMIIGSMYSVLQILEDKGPVDNLMGASILLNSCCYIAVNCFILISGYYGIKFKVRGLVRLYFFTVFYVLLGVLWNGQTIDRTRLLWILFPFSNYPVTLIWFLKCYVILYLLAPLLNKAIESMGKREFVYALIALSIANVYFGWIWGYYNDHGYCVAQFIYVYFIAAYIRRYININSLRSAYLWGGYIASTLMFGIISVASHYIHIPMYRSYAYNNPLMILGAIFFFMAFMKINIKNAYINWLASGTLAIYLAQEMPWRECMANYILKSNSIILLVILCISYACSKTILVLLFDKVRQHLIERPIFLLYDKVSGYVKLPG